MLKLDYTLETPEERNEAVKKYIKENPDVNEKYLEVLADYLITSMEKQERKEGKAKQNEILTDNRMVTINKRETSFEGLAAQFENGEDGVYNLVTHDKHVIFRPKVSITKRDLENIPELLPVREAISYWNEVVNKTTGKEKYIAKKALIDCRKEQYVIKESVLKPIVMKQLTRTKFPMEFPCEEYVVKGETFADTKVVGEGLSFLNPKAVSAILCNYSKLKRNCMDQFDGDEWYIMEDFDNLCEKALRDYPVFERIVECKIDGMKNIDIQYTLQMEFGLNHSVEYISSLWRNKIPSIIASCAEDEFLNWYFLEREKGVYKKCSRCGEIKLALPKYFSKNRTSRDGFYSICKCCRNKKAKKI